MSIFEWDVYAFLPRRYNAPTAPEIAVIIPGDGYTEGVATRDIVLHARTGGLKRITETNCAYDSLHYVYCFLQEITAGTWAFPTVAGKAVLLQWSSTLTA